MAKSKSKKTTTHTADSTYKQARAFQIFLSKRAQPIDKGIPVKFAHANTVSGEKVTFNGDTEIHGHALSESEQKRRIAVCREMYENFGITGNMIDIMVDFALENLTIEHTSPRIRNIYVNWARQVDLYGLSEAFLKSYYRDGNVPIFKMMATVTPEEIRKLRKKVVAEDEKKRKKKKKKKKSSPTYSVIKSQFDETESRRIPMRYRILNVLKMNKMGSDLLGTSHYQYTIGSKEVRGLKSPKTEQERDAREKFRKFLGQQAFDRFVQTGRLDLPSDRLDVIHYKKDHWQNWATPMLWRISDDVRFKQLLREMDISLAEGVTNALTIIKLGDSEKGFHPSKKHISK
jgi:hypothetical protein